MQNTDQRKYSQIRKTPKLEKGFLVSALTKLYVRNLLENSLLFFLIFKIIINFRERGGEEKERERNSNVREKHINRLPLRQGIGTQPTTQAYTH